jgi:hypothetical protein
MLSLVRPVFANNYRLIRSANSNRGKPGTLARRPAAFVCGVDRAGRIAGTFLREGTRGDAKEERWNSAISESSSGLEVMLAHPGGPFWAKKDEGAWSESP